MLALTLSGLGLVLSPSQGPARGKAALQKKCDAEFHPSPARFWQRELGKQHELSWQE